ncbi:MAG: (Fe-S)-binding protein [Acidobacteriota bacterium]|nr:(Fe-S)-binding protein [Acidobacteriota bacterium]MDH3522396.1 (Fe-S)-binding protein [Acidobacteriota bacterium]
MLFAGWEQALLVVLVAASAGLFVHGLLPKIRHIRAGRPERPRTDRLPARLLRVIREVVFQSRVVGGRPVAGALHALVFFGFVFFGLETADHFLEPFYVPLLATIFGGALPLFKGFLAVVAVLTAVGIVGLAYRRFVMVKISPDPKSYSSGVVALMILVLMLTYLYGLDEAAPFQKANWWLHSLLIVAFPPLILRSKHFHILMAPVDIFLRTHELGEYLPLELDEEALMAAEEEVSLGLETMADVPWKMRMDFLSCVECKRCTDQCPAAGSGQELNPRGFILAGRAALGGDGGVIGSVITETALGQCTSCGACESICPVGIEHLQLLIGAKRAQALASGKGMVAADFLQDVERYGNPFKAPGDARGKLIAELGIPLYRAGETEYLLWLGCVWTYNEDARSSLAATLRLLDEAGVSYGVLEEESCSGHHSRRQGEELQFQTLANENIGRLRERQVAKVVTGCPHCFHTIRREYPTLDASFEVETIHHSELLVELLRQGRLRLAGGAGAGRKVTFHDPCYLGRYEKVFDAPRQAIASAGFELLELPRRRERSFCCGGGSAGFMSQREEEKRVDLERKREIGASGAEVLVTACPECKMMLDAAVAETVDLAELVAGSLQSTSEA